MAICHQQSQYRQDTIEPSLPVWEINLKARINRDFGKAPYGTPFSWLYWVQVFQTPTQAPRLLYRAIIMIIIIMIISIILTQMIQTAPGIAPRPCWLPFRHSAACALFYYWTTVTGLTHLQTQTSKTVRRIDLQQLCLKIEGTGFKITERHPTWRHNLTVGRLANGRCDDRRASSYVGHVTAVCHSKPSSITLPVQRVL